MIAEKTFINHYPTTPNHTMKRIFGDRQNALN
jgi:hypothetical protein